MYLRSLREILISISLTFFGSGLESTASSRSASSTRVSRSSRSVSTWTFWWISSMVLAPRECQISLPWPLDGCTDWYNLAEPAVFCLVLVQYQVRGDGLPQFIEHAELSSKIVSHGVVRKALLGRNQTSYPCRVRSTPIKKVRHRCMASGNWFFNSWILETTLRMFVSSNSSALATSSNTPR